MPARHRLSWLWPLALSGLLAIASSSIPAAQPILERGYDAGVSGANLTETTLNTSNVGPGIFGLLFILPVDDNILAQPLYVPNVSIANQGTHNVVYVATMSDSLYAFDADVGGAPLWSVNLASLLGETPVPFANFSFGGNENIIGNLGILSTPVIDPSSNLLYVLACTLENGTMAYRLHAVDITSGAQPLGPGVLISGSYNGVTFDARYVTQRASLALSGNNVVFGFGAVEYEYYGGYVGWVMAYSKQTLAQSGVFAAATAGNGGGVWQSGRPPAIDSSGYAYLFTGNAYVNGYDGVNNFGESALKFDPSNGLQLVDWFTPGDWATLDGNDNDLSSAGPLLIPGTNLLAGGGKAGVFYVLNTTNLGKYNSTDSQIVQEWAIAANDMRGGPVYWQRSAANGGPLLYDAGSWDYVKAFAFNGTQFTTTPGAQSSSQLPWPGGILAVSANSDTPGSGVLWANVALSGASENSPPVPGALYAFNASNVSQQLYSSTTNGSDALGNFAKFVPPTVANGKVYMATWSNQVAVYGLLSDFSAAPTALVFGTLAINTTSPSSAVAVTNTGTQTLSLNGISISNATFAQTNNCGTSLAAGSNCTINVVFRPTTVGPVAATLSINSSSAGTLAVALTGTGATASYSVSPTSLAFGNQIINTASSAVPVTVTNTGSLAVTLTGITVSNSTFSQTNNCGASLAVGGSCTINVVFQPSATGAASGSLTVTASGGLAAQSVTLGGTGVAAAYTIAPLSLAFGNLAINSASPASPVTVTNTGTVAVPIAGIALSTGGTQPFAQTNNCGSSLAVGASCTINVVFSPATTGAASASLNLTAGAGAAPQSVALSGMGAIPSYALSPTSVSFGSQQTGTASAASSIKMSNTGIVPVTIASIALAPQGIQALSSSTSDPTSFSQSNDCGSSLAVNASCTISVGFNPVAAGAVAATLSINTNGVSTSVSLSGSGRFQVALTASTKNTTAGDPVMLSWTSTTGATCTPSGGGAADGWSGTLTANGTLNVTEASGGNYSYTLTCTDRGVSASASVAVTMTVPTVSLSAASATVTVGHSVTLTWSSQNASTCTASGGQSGDSWAGSRPTQGSASITPSAAGNITYTMTCTSGPKNVQASATVTASDPPSSSGGGGAFDPLMLLSLLGALGASASRSAPAFRWRGRCSIPVPPTR